jgi:hypothetical protein
MFAQTDLRAFAIYVEYFDPAIQKTGRDAKTTEHCPESMWLNRKQTRYLPPSASWSIALEAADSLGVVMPGLGSGEPFSRNTFLTVSG